jgi:adenosylcobinamide amidohydrolase
MNLLVVKEKIFNDLTVVAAVTGGVESNAGRAGDPAYGYEDFEGYQSLSPLTTADSFDTKEGTINIMLFISKPLTPGALIRTIITATEAKTMALQELNVNSRYSDGLASGTGTDQIAVASMNLEDYRPLTNAGKHSKLGELIGKAVKSAVREVLVRQNGMSVDRQCSIKIHLERFNQNEVGKFGLKTEELVQMVVTHLSEDLGTLFKLNHRGILHDPINVAAVAAMAHLKDKFSWRILPILIWPEVMLASAAQVAAAVGGHHEKYHMYREMLTPDTQSPSNKAFLTLIAKAIALGYQDKWI